MTIFETNRTASQSCASQREWIRRDFWEIRLEQSSSVKVVLHLAPNGILLSLEDTLTNGRLRTYIDGNEASQLGLSLLERAQHRIVVKGERQ